MTTAEDDAGRSGLQGSTLYATTSEDNAAGGGLQDTTPSAKQECRPPRPRVGLGNLLDNPTMQIIGIAIVVLVFIYCWAWFESGSSEYVNAYLRGDRLLVRPTTDLTFEDGRVGEERDFFVRVINLTGDKVQLLGVNQSCTCLITTNSFPLTLNPREDCKIPIKVFFHRKEDFDQRLVFWTDYKYTPNFTVRISGNVEP